MERVSENFVGKHFYCEVLVLVQNLVIYVVGYLRSDNSDLQWQWCHDIEQEKETTIGVGMLVCSNSLPREMLTKFVHVHNIILELLMR